MSLFESSNEEKIQRLERALDWAQATPQPMYPDYWLDLQWGARKQLEFLKRCATKPAPEYIVISDKYPYHRHTSMSQAVFEAHRLANMSGGKFTILKVKSEIVGLGTSS